MLALEMMCGTALATLYGEMLNCVNYLLQGDYVFNFLVCLLAKYVEK